MTEPYIGEIQVFAFSFAPINWAFAAGQMMPLRQYTALFSLYGLNFGGDGANTFGLPNLAGRQGCGAGQGPGTQKRTIGEAFGSYSISLTSDAMPMHNHIFSDYVPAGTQTAVPTPSSAIGYAANDGFAAFATPGATATLNSNAIGAAGNGAVHPNAQPYLGLNYSVALTGVFPQFG